MNCLGKFVECAIAGHHQPNIEPVMQSVVVADRKLSVAFESSIRSALLFDLPLFVINNGHIARNWFMLNEL